MTAECKVCNSGSFDEENIDTHSNAAERDEIMESETNHRSCMSHTHHSHLLTEMQTSTMNDKLHQSVCSNTPCHKHGRHQTHASNLSHLDRILPGQSDVCSIQARTRGHTADADV